MNILAFWLMLCYAVSVIAQSDQLERNSTVTTENHPTETLRPAPPLQDVNTVRQFPGYNRRNWEKVAQNLRTHILVSTGQYPYYAPMAKAELNAQVFDRIEREDYTVEKAYFESYPGFFCTGNLYRPRGKEGPFPGIISPHGHWDRGRLENIERGSIPGRCINFARQGYVVFSYDMAGYNDSGRQVEHRSFPSGTREGLWGISLMGLQLQNAIRAIDFLQTLPDVDPDQIGCTGASGGGTQTFMLMAIDDRVKVAAPVNMISAHMQGGCLCENSPNLRIDFSNMEIGAMMAPRPLLLVSATGDWTKDTPTVEYPVIRSIYQHFEATERIHQVQIDAEHNYNQASREAVYQWFGKWFLDQADPSTLKETDFEVEADEDLLAFSHRSVPYHALDDEQLIQSLIHQAKAAIECRKPTDVAGLETFQSEMGMGLSHALALQDGLDSAVNLLQKVSVEPTATEAALIVYQNGDIDSLVKQLDQHQLAVFALPLQPTGRDTGSGFFTTYNRTDPALWAQDILSALKQIHQHLPEISAINLIGINGAGPITMLVAGFSAADRVIIDVEHFDASSDDAFIDELPIPSLRRTGDFRTAGALIAPKPLLLLNTGQQFPTQWVADLYSVAGKPDQFTSLPELADSIQLETQIINWLKEL